MKRVNPRKVAIALAILGVAALISGCGSANSNGAPPGTPVAAVAPGVVTPGVAAGCLSMAQPLGFSDQMGYVDSINVRFGTLPTTDPFAPGQTYGQVIDTVGGTGGPYMAPNNQLTISPDGSISMNITPVNSGQMPITGMTTGVVAPYGTNYGLGSTAMMTGTVSISSAKQQLVMSELASTYPTMSPMSTIPGQIPMPQTGVNLTSSICIVSIAGSLSHSGYNLYGGHVYAYFYVPNMSMTGIPGMTTTMNPAQLTGTALYSLPKIVLTW